MRAAFPRERGRPTTTRPAAGGIEAYRYVQLLSPPHLAHPYEYDLQFEDYSGLIPAQHFAAVPGQLATVTDSFYSAARSPHVGWSSGGESRAELRYTHFGFLPAYAVQVPGMLTDYVTAGRPRVVWGAAILDGYASQYGADASYAPGATASGTWGNYPLHTAANVSLLGQADLFPTMVSAARAGNVVHLDVVPFSDSTPGHNGQGFSWTGNNGDYRVYANGTRVASGTVTGTILPWTDLAVRAVFPPSPATLRFVVDARRAGPDPLSSSTSTAWTWRTRYVRGALLPSGWWCGFSRNCSVEPMMTLGYSIRGLSLSGTVRPGAQLIDIAVGHIQLAAASPATGLTAQISLDGGKSWQAARVSRSGAGIFRVSFAAAAGHLVSLRVHAADAVGGQIAETIMNAYRIARP